MEKNSTRKEDNIKSSISEKVYTENKMKMLSTYALETLKEMFRSLRYPEFKFARSGIIITVVLTLVSLSFFILPEIRLASFNLSANIFGIPISLVIAFIVIYFWFLLGFKITPLAAHYLVDNKILKLFFTKGDVHYLEYIPAEKRKITLPNILNKYIALIIAWVSVSAFLLNLITGGNPVNVVNPGGRWDYLILRTIIIFFIVPIIFTLIYPLGWMLMDAKLKAYNSATKLNWLVGTKVNNITAGIITLGSLFALGASALGDIGPGLQLILDLLVFCIINVSLIVILISLFYNVFFHGKFYKLIVDSLEVGFGITSVTLVDSEGKSLPEPEPEDSTWEE